MVAAAAECQVTQPTLSTQIKALETELGVRWFYRHARGARLTRAGERMLGSVNRVMDELRQLQRGIGPGAVTHIQVLRLGVQPAIATEVMPGPLAQFTAEFPDWRFTVREGRVDYLVELLQSEYVDVCVTSCPSQLPAELEAREIFRARFAAYCRADHPLAGKAAVQLREVVPFPLVVFSSPVQMLDRLQAISRQQKMESRVVLTCRPGGDGV